MNSFVKLGSLFLFLYFCTFLGSFFTITMAYVVSNSQLCKASSFHSMEMSLQCLTLYWFWLFAWIPIFHWKYRILSIFFSWVLLRSSEFGQWIWELKKFWNVRYFSTVSSGTTITQAFSVYVHHKLWLYLFCSLLPESSWSPTSSVLAWLGDLWFWSNWR